MCIIYVIHVYNQKLGKPRRYIRREPIFRGIFKPGS